MASGTIQKANVSVGNSFAWTTALNNLEIITSNPAIGFSANETSFQIRLRLPNSTNDIRLYIGSDHGYLQSYSVSSGWTTLKTIY